MAQRDILELRAELLAFKTLMAPCLKFLAVHHEAPNDYLDNLNKSGVKRIIAAAPKLAAPKDVDDFVATATAWLGAAIEAAKSTETSSVPQRH
jgi:hypothetical protein